MTQELVDVQIPACNLLAGKKVFITGGTRGIGRAICTLFAQQGADIAFNYKSNEQAAAEIQTEIEALGRRCISFKASVSDLPAVRQMFKEGSKFLGGLDILVNNASIKKDGFAAMIPEQDWVDVIDTNLKGSFYCCREGIKLMLRKKTGVIINLTSLSGIIGNIGQAHYAASKGGLIALTKTLAKELAEKNIRVNGIAPGLIKTDMIENIPEKILESHLTALPMKRFGESIEVATVALFLASDLSTYMTGEVINVNGGLYM